MQLTRWAICRMALLRDAVAWPERLTPEQARFLIERAWRCAVYEEVVNAMPTQPPAQPFFVMPCPIRLVWGAKDRLLPINGYSERWRFALPEADWVVLPEVGHVQMYDDPDAVVRVILDFTACARNEEQRLAS
jgi:pimeloyl-ACP methyl ester carboxylesterase